MAAGVSRSVWTAAGFAAGLVVATAGALLVWSVDFFSGRPRIDTSRPAVVRQIQQLQRLETVVYAMDKIVSGGYENKYLPRAFTMNFFDAKSGALQLSLGYWNEWYLSSLYLGSTVEFKPLQYHLYNIINTANALKNSVAGSNISVTDLPSNTLKMASAIVAIGPILLLYPFIQKYFVSGITIGAVKG